MTLRSDRRPRYQGGRPATSALAAAVALFVLAQPAQALQIFYDQPTRTADGSFQFGFYLPPPVPRIDPGPRDLRLKSENGSRVEIEYRCAQGATSYRYYRQVDGGSWQYHSGGLCPSTWGRILDIDAMPRENYCYYVLARNDLYEVPSDSFCLTTGGIPRVPARSDLDRQLPASARAERTMTSGRLSKVPASAFWTSRLQGGELGSDHDPIFRAVCSIAHTEAGRCDTGLVVSYESCGGDGTCGAAMTLYNDDNPDPRNRGDGSGSGSWVDPPRQPHGVSRYTVHLFSQLRATSRTRLEYSLDGGATWRLTMAEREVGGTLVDPGPLHAGDWLEAESLDDGAGESDTRMILFHPSSALPMLEASDRSGRDADPRIDITASGYERGMNLLLVGKQRNGAVVNAASNEAVETWVDLVHGPHPDATSVSNTVCNGACAADLEPGRYLLWVYANIDQPVGSIDPRDPSQNHLSGDMPAVEMCGDGSFSSYECRQCPNDALDGLADATWYRGRTNDIALSLDLQQEFCGRAGGTCYWHTLATRDVTRAVLGTQPGQGLNLLSMELAAQSRGRYRIRVREHVAGLNLFPEWRYQRNAEATELKLVSFNTLFGGADWNPAKFRNTANLLGTRGSIRRADGRVEMRHDQAPFQWEADVFGMQEVTKRYTDGEAPDAGYSFETSAELRAKSAMEWSFSLGRGENWWKGISDGPGMNPTFVNRFHQPEGSIWFSDAAKQAAGCSDCERSALGVCLSHKTYYMECKLGENGIGHGDTENFATPAKVRARRSDPQSDRPIATFNVHLEASDGAADFTARLGEVETLMQKIDALLAAEPEAFNREGSSSPRHHQNRIVIFGDWNIRCHYCGEHYWLLRKLREHYGYAVDTSMAVLDRNGRASFGMHDQAEPLDVDGVPAPFQHPHHPDLRPQNAWQAWRDAPDHGEDSVYPWWAADYRGTSNDMDGVGERLSAVFLVGRGWAYDDPVLDYRLMNDRASTSPMHATPRAVEMWFDDDCNDGGSVSYSGGAGYAPNHSLGCDASIHGGTKPGAAALHSDHKPIGVRLRVWQR